MTKRQGYYRFYNAGKFNGRGEDHIMFCFYGPDKTPGQCQLVPASHAAAELAAIKANRDYLPLTE